MKDRGNDRIFAFGSAGAKARAYFAMLAARLKPCPCYKACFDQFFDRRSSRTFLMKHFCDWCWRQS